MHTLENSAEIKEYILSNIQQNLPRVDADSIKNLLGEISLDVCAKSKNSYLNLEFNSLIKTLIKIKSQDIISIYDVTEFFYYYQNLLKKINVSFISSI